MFSKRFELVKQDAECCCSCNEFCFSPPCKPMLLSYCATMLLSHIPFMQGERFCSINKHLSYACNINTAGKLV